MIGECEMTGRKDVQLFRVKIEGTIMQVCKECIKYGELLREPKKQSFHFKERDELPEEVIVLNAGQLIKQAREQKKMTQTELAKLLHLKESLLHNIESGHFTPTLETAKKIQKTLHIKLLETVKKVEIKKSQKAEPLTMEQKLKEAMQKAKK